MTTRLVTAILLIACGLIIGWSAFQNLMWAVWGKQNLWYEYVGFWGCPIMIIAGIVALWKIRIGTYLGLLGYVMMLFYFAPALVVTIKELTTSRFSLNFFTGIFLIFIVVLPLLTAARLGLNVSSALRQAA